MCLLMHLCRAILAVSKTDISWNHAYLGNKEEQSLSSYTSLFILFLQLCTNSFISLSLMLEFSLVPWLLMQMGVAFQLMPKQKSVQHAEA